MRRGRPAGRHKKNNMTRLYGIDHLSFGAGVYSGYGENIFSRGPHSVMGDVYSAASSIGREGMGMWPSLFRRPGGVGAFMEAELQRYKRMHPDKGPKRNGKKELSPDIASADPGERSKGYLRQLMDKSDGKKGLPSQSKVLKSALGDEGYKDKDRLSAASGDDQKLRLITERIVADELSDPRKRDALAKRWASATNEADRARALFDPLGNGAYLPILREVVPGAIKSDGSGDWSSVASWLKSNLDVLDDLGGEAYSIAMSLPRKGEEPIGETERAKLVNRMEKLGYEREEAEKAAALADTQEAADAFLKSFTSQLTTDTVKLEEARNRKERLEQALPALTGQDKSKTERDIEELTSNLAAAEKAKVRVFYNNCSAYVLDRYNRDLGKMPANVINVDEVIRLVK